MALVTQTHAPTFSRRTLDGLSRFLPQPTPLGVSYPEAISAKMARPKSQRPSQVRDGRGPPFLLITLLNFVPISFHADSSFSEGVQVQNGYTVGMHRSC